MSLKLTFAALSAALLLSPLMAEAVVPQCVAPKPPADATTMLPAILTCIQNNSTAGDCGRTRYDVKVFQNREGLLPAPGANHAYYEAKIRNSGAPAGTKRWVILTQTNVVPRVTSTQNYTGDHYASFCVYP